ncbi:MAG TPA: 3-deoxy-7-phosphoheptulonate synthase [Chloroflexi bacterium]|nr:3-deoxy-7-phosphoheptulonate synthase [Chloroflexota bacterium]|tara:strand:- start:2281 stop:3309 length:1029 start_codon:yes stop_codon:yes gene_type:complete
MIIVMQDAATQEDILAIEERVRAEGLETRVLRGVEKTVIALIGKRPPELAEQIERMPGVFSAMPIGEPFKLAARSEATERSRIQIGNATIGNGSAMVMAGPCTVENRDQLLTTARHVAAAGATVLRGGAFKPRSSPYSFQGLGVEGLKLLVEARETTGLPVITEVLDPRHVDVVADHADVLQVGTRNAQNYVLLRELGTCEKPIMLKRGMGNTIDEWLMCAEYIMASGNPDVILCERGIRTFETSSRFTLDLNAIPLLRRRTHLPIAVDPSQGTGHWFMVEALSLAAIAAGADGIIVEVHPTPDVALIDGQQSLSLENFSGLMTKLEPLAASLGRSTQGVDS